MLASKVVVDEPVVRRGEALGDAVHVLWRNDGEARIIGEFRFDPTTRLSKDIHDGHQRVEVVFGEKDPKPRSTASLPRTG